MKRLLFFVLIAVFLTACNSTQPVVVVPDGDPTRFPVTETAGVPTQTATATDTATATATEQVFDKMELSTDPNKPGKCTYEDVTSGKLAWNILNQFKGFPTDAINTGWVNIEGGSMSDVGLKAGSKDALQIGAICKIDNSFMGYPGNSYVYAMAALNTDGSTGIIPFILNNNPVELNALRRLISSHTESNLVIHRENYSGKTPESQIYNFEDYAKISESINSLEINGKVPKQMQRMLFTAYWSF